MRLAFSIPMVFCLTVTAVFAQEEKNILVNMKTIPMKDVETLTINSCAGLLILLESKNNSVVMKEYQDESGKNTSQGNPSVTSVINSEVDADTGYEFTIETVTRVSPFPIGGYTEVYIPASFRGAISIIAEGGIVRSEVNLYSNRQVDISITDGDLELKQVFARQIKIAVSSGSFQAEKLSGTEISLHHTSGLIDIGEVRGRLSVEALSGPITVRELTGGGSIVTQAGTINVGLRNAMDDFSCALTTGSITITTPSDLFYNLDAEAKSGAITVTPPRGTPIKAYGSVQWVFGSEADVTISTRVSTGSITVGPRIDIE
jgi:hypothetical protein